MTKLTEIRARLEQLTKPERAEFAKRYFKTGPGQYGEGDVFLGLSAPELRALAREFAPVCSTTDQLELLRSPIHDERALTLLMWVRLFPKATEDRQAEIYRLYLENTRHINNWDLVDVSAPHIVGKYLLHRERAVLRQLAVSESLWERRIAIIATQQFIRQNQFDDTIAIAETLLSDKHDLIHKAVGWMLREVGQRAPEREREFLRTFHHTMPRTMLRYAIEKFPEAERQEFLKKPGRKTNSDL